MYDFLQKMEEKKCKVACCNQYIPQLVYSESDLSPMGLYMGSVHAAENVMWLNDNKITFVLSVGASPFNWEKVDKRGAIRRPNGTIQWGYPSSIRHKHIEVQDDPTADLYSHFDTANEFIDEALSMKKRILVHWYPKTICPNAFVLPSNVVFFIYLPLPLYLFLLTMCHLARLESLAAQAL